MTGDIGQCIALCACLSLSLPFCVCMGVYEGECVCACVCVCERECVCVCARGGRACATLGDEKYAAENCPSDSMRYVSTNTCATS